MRLINGEESREMDRIAAKEFSLPALVLMENAGLRSYDFIRNEIGLQPGRVSVLLGKGNNGGDGLVLARHLYNNGYDVRLFSLFDPEEFSPSSAANWAIAEAMGMECQVIRDERDLLLVKVVLLSSKLIVDAVFGSGFRGDAVGLTAALFRSVNESQKPVLALDLPSGVNGDDGSTSDPAITATWTIAFGLPKFGNVISPGAEYGGKLTVADISFPNVLLTPREGDAIYLDESWAQSQIKPRSPQSHKGNFGHVLICGGAKGMIGAPLLAGKAALRCGSGLVTYMVPRSLEPAVMTQNLEALTIALPENEEQCLDQKALTEIFRHTGNKVMALGMGISRHEDTLELAAGIIRDANCPLLVDADALLALNRIEERKKSFPLILTPHPGEMARMLNCSIREVQEDRIAAVRAAAEKWQATVVLKGQHSLIASGSGSLLVNSTGNPGMATGGMGDTLSGIIISLLGQGYDAETATALGVYLHGLAGDIAAEENGEMSVIAGDIITYLPKAICQARG